jgi:hypothetical protein
MRPRIRKGNADPEHARQMSEQTSAQPSAPEKSCGSCTECCRMMAVNELKKPAWTACTHCAAGVGCKIYPQRPQSCRDFNCGWLMAPYMGPELKPDKCHIIFFQPDAHTMVANCDPAWPDAWRAPHVTAFLHFLAKAFARRVVLVRVENRFWRIFEDRVMQITS